MKRGFLFLLVFLILLSLVYAQECQENWLCQEWTECNEDNFQARTCVDLNKYGTLENRPDLVKDCNYTIAPAAVTGFSISEAFQNNLWWIVLIVIIILIILMFWLLKPRTSEQLLEKAKELHKQAEEYNLKGMYQEAEDSKKEAEECRKKAREGV